MRALFIVAGRPAFGPDPDPYQGSAYKYGELLKQLCDVTVLRADDPKLESHVLGADLCVVRADRFTHYRTPLAAGVPYLAIAHDLATMRDSGSEAAGLERELLEHARAVLFATGPLQEFAAQRYRLPASEVIALRPLARDLDFTPRPKWGEKTLVYAGGIAPMHQADTPWGYRALRNELREARAAGWDVHVYPNRNRRGVNREYADAGITMHNQVPPRYLYEELSQYTAGLQIFNTAGVPPDALDYVRLAWPNKAWEYLAAGIPTIGINPGFEAARIYEGRWGIVLGENEDWRSLQPEDLPSIDVALRRSEVIDADLPKLAGLLERVTAAAH